MKDQLPQSWFEWAIVIPFAIIVVAMFVALFWLVNDMGRMLEGKSPRHRSGRGS